MTTDRVAKVAWRFGWAMVITAALLAPKAAEAAWYTWLLRLR
jgi:hypothetical protein